MAPLVFPPSALTKLQAWLWQRALIWRPLFDVSGGRCQFAQLWDHVYDQRFQSQSGLQAFKQQRLGKSASDLLFCSFYTFQMVFRRYSRLWSVVTMHFTAVITENAVVMIVPNVYMFMFQIEEHRICVCVRARPLNKKGESLLKVTFLINETPHSFF